MILVDVRSSEEYKENHINNSISIPLESLHEDIENEAPNKSTTIFVYCNSGNKSGKAAEMLDKLGYTNVYDLGGMVNWPYETIRGN
ncbi:rhodanese-like domain-containing protein [Clostridium tetanomorphum]|uniref:rhodanese-like domain-containing protein n=1 Tax=Clostridium tetanomorphum TaxID=1553 RepID=UPI000DD01848